MKKIIAFLSFCILLVQTNFGQETLSPLTKTWTVNILPFGGGIIGEFPVSKKSTVKVELGASLILASSEDSENELDLGTGYITYGAIHYRQFYKFKAVNRKEKPLFFNSGNFFFAQLSGSSPSFFNSRDSFEWDGGAAIGGGWGLQRMYKNNFVFSFGIGGGYSLTSSKIVPVLDLTFGILLKPKAGKK